MEVPSSITDKEIHNDLSEIKQQLTFTHSPKETASIMQMIESSIDDFLSEHPSATAKATANFYVGSRIEKTINKSATLTGSAKGTFS